MKFNDYKYIRPDLEELEKELNGLTDEFDKSKTFDEQSIVFDKINNIKKDLNTMSNLVYIRHSINTLDEYYKKEQDFLDEEMPKFNKVLDRFNKSLISAKYREKLEAKWGQQLFRLIEMEREVFSEDIIEDMVEENKLEGEYSKLLASAEIEFEGEVRNLSQLAPFRQSKDRSMRKRANEACNGFFEDNEDKLDDIYDRLVKVRTRMAKKLGYDNYVEMGYKRMSRSDYDASDVKGYRDQVYREIVPLVANLKERQRKRLEYEYFKYYDDNFEFLTGNPIPKGDSKWIMEQGKRMYSELSNETNEFFNLMIDRDLMDLETKKGKMGGGYCTYIDNYESPFIFANFNGTLGDVDVLTHEAGHAFQKFMSRDNDLVEYNFATSEAAEIHSMSMEFITWPWMELFFKEDVDKYKFTHLSGCVSFLPYGVTVDEFQHYVYENPEVSPSERKSKWREIEKKYMPYLNYDESEFLERGGFWFRQGHIFEDPFYYIDYTLAQICAFQFFNKFNENKEAAWNDYLRLCEKGGSQSFLELLEVANLKNPFLDGTIKKTIEPISTWLDKIDDTVL